MGRKKKETVPLTPAQKRLVEENLGLVRYAIRRLDPCSIRFLGGWEDALSCGAIHLCHVARCFRPELGYAFSTYAVDSLVKSLREESYTKRAIRLPRWAKGEGPRVQTGLDGLLQMFESPPENLVKAGKTERHPILTPLIELNDEREWKEAEEETERMLCCLSERDREVVTKLAILESHAPYELAREMNVSRQRIHQIYTRALKKMRAWREETDDVRRVSKVG